jgi:hypothetical protein
MAHDGGGTGARVRHGGLDFIAGAASCLRGKGMPDINVAGTVVGPRQARSTEGTRTDRWGNDVRPGGECGRGAWQGICSEGGATHGPAVVGLPRHARMAAAHVARCAQACSGARPRRRGATRVCSIWFSPS